MWLKIKNFFRNSWLWIKSKFTLATFDKSISLIALIISILSLALTGYQYIKSTQELISIFPYQPDSDYMVKFLKSPDDDEIYALPLPMKLLISNDGDKTVSLVYFGKAPYSKTNQTPFYTSQSDAGFIDELQKPLRLPFVIPAGESKTFVYIHTFMFNKNYLYDLNQIYKKYRGKDMWDESINYYDLLRYATEGNINLFGTQFASRPEGMKGDPGSVLNDISLKKGAEPFLTIFFKSSKGNEFKQDLTFLIFPQ